jgi:hypothetical protein
VRLIVCQIQLQNCILIKAKNNKTKVLIYQLEDLLREIDNFRTLIDSVFYEENFTLPSITTSIDHYLYKITKFKSLRSFHLL